MLRDVIGPDEMIYVLALVKYAHAFFPKESFNPDFLELRHKLEFSSEAVSKFDDLYRKTVNEIMTAERLCGPDSVNIYCASGNAELVAMTSGGLW